MKPERRPGNTAKESLRNHRRDQEGQKGDSLKPKRGPGNTAKKSLRNHKETKKGEKRFLETIVEAMKCRKGSP